VIKKQEDGRSKKRPGAEEQAVVITQAAVELFSEHGTQGVSIAQICTHANVSRPTFYRCFTDKDELISSIYQHSVNAHVEEILRSIQTKGPKDEQWLQKALGDLFEAIFAQSQLAQLVFIESADPDSPASQIVDQAFEHAATAMERSLAEFTNSKPSRVYLKAIMAACQWIAHDAMKKGLTKKAKAEAKEAVWQLICRSLLSG
jgi:TetR/AcrR family transcriptional regulator